LRKLDATRHIISSSAHVRGTDRRWERGPQFAVGEAVQLLRTVVGRVDDGMVGALLVDIDRAVPVVASVV
jgi:hypothetical protein